MPDFLAAGPREVSSRKSAEVARELLRDTQTEPPPGAARPNLVKLVAAMLGGAGTALIAWLLQS